MVTRMFYIFFFQAEDGIRDLTVTGVQTCALPILNHGQGFTANLTTAILVVLATLFGLPVSTTHVSVGSLFGIGLTTGKANLRVISAIVFSWLITLPCAAILGGLIYCVSKSFHSLTGF